MGYPINEYRNKAVVLLVKAGMNFYQISKAFGKKDKRNFIRIFQRDQNKYFLPSEQNASQGIQNQSQKSE